MNISGGLSISSTRLDVVQASSPSSGRGRLLPAYRADSGEGGVRAAARGGCGRAELFAAPGKPHLVVDVTRWQQPVDT